MITKVGRNMSVAFTFQFYVLIVEKKLNKLALKAGVNAGCEVIPHGMQFQVFSFTLVPTFNMFLNCIC
jgi:hypothetical protein